MTVATSELEDWIFDEDHQVYINRWDESIRIPEDSAGTYHLSYDTERMRAKALNLMLNKIAYEEKRKRT